MSSATWVDSTELAPEEATLFAGRRAQENLGYRLVALFNLTDPEQLTDRIQKENGHALFAFTTEECRWLEDSLDGVLAAGGAGQRIAAIRDGFRAAIESFEQMRAQAGDG